MAYDKDKVDEMALALLYFGSFKQEDEDIYPWQAWKSIDWDIMDRLHEKGYIGDPKNKRKSITFTDKGFQMGEQIFEKHFKIEGSSE